MATENKRSVLEKDPFMGGNRQKWCAIFTAIGIAIGIGSVYGKITDPKIYLEYFASIGMTFILGASATNVLKLMKVNPQSIPPSEEEIRPKTDEDIIKEHEERRVEDPSYRPVMPDEHNEEPWR